MNNRSTFSFPGPPKSTYIPGRLKDVILNLSKCFLGSIFVVTSQNPCMFTAANWFVKYVIYLFLILGYRQWQIRDVFRKGAVNKKQRC